MRVFKTISIFASLSLFVACATYQAQFNTKSRSTISSKEIAHTFYLIGDAGNAAMNESTPALNTLKIELSKADRNGTLLFLGDNIYPHGLEKNNLSKHRLQTQIDAAKNFQGNTIFIPGNHDWYSGLDALKDQEKMVEKALGKNTFLPENGCPIEKVNISKDIVLIVVDTHWYLTNWDNHPKMNDDCEIKTRAKFFDEFKSLLKKAQGKTAIVAMHHPMFTSGPHGGNYSFGSHMSPLPILGSLKNILRKTTGVSNADLQNKKYNELKKQIVTLAQQNEKTIFVSGHEHSLQYIVQDNIPQIVSGSGSKESATKLGSTGLYSEGKQGYAKLIIYKDGSSHVQFFTTDKKEPSFETTVINPNKPVQLINYPDQFPNTQKASVYTQKEVTKGGTYKFFWGDRYRKYYGTQVNAPTVNLDTLFGGLKPTRKGGGNQSKSLRLEDKDGREFVMRALRKNALQYLQAVAFRDQYIEGQFNDTYTEGLLQDAFTGAHPYAPFVIGTLADAIGVYHTNPVLYYIPKQNALGKYNADFGNELYMIEERAADGHGNQKSFGYSNKLISTDDLLKELHKDEDNTVDEKAYIKARLFDMLIGDWDRHEDQWRWAKFKEGKKTVYRPVPRDRDQAFSIMADGLLLSFATKVMTTLSLMQSYDEELKNVPGFNLEPYPLDMALINEATKADWDAQVNTIVNGITDDVIEKAFAFFPTEVQDETIQEIKRKLKGRKANLQKISDTYFKHMSKFQVVKGTDKDDWFDIERMPNGQTKVNGYRIKKGEKADIIHQKTYSREHTREIWVYGLDDDDQFVVSGKGNNYIKVRIIGGQNKDTYDIQNGAKVVVYDYKSKKSEFKTNKGKKRLTDDYETNVYNHKKLKLNSRQFLPSIGSNPDDGLKIGFAHTYIANGFERNPFTYKHSINGAVYLATSGFELNYNGEIANVVGRANLGINASFTSPNFATNFFGFGNQSVNLDPDDDAIDRDFNRVKMRQLRFGTSLNWKGDLGSLVKLSATYEAIEVERTTGRFIETAFAVNNPVFNNQNFIGAELSYHFANTDNAAFPTLGMAINLATGYKSNIDESTGFGYLKPSIAFDYKLTNNGRIVFATKLAGQLNFGDDFEFYQGARLGARNGLRGYRFDRFIGKSSFYQSSDIRFNVKKFKTGLIPLTIGLYGGFDYGKVWAPNLPTGDWNTSVGGGFIFDAADMMSASIAAFSSDDGMRIAFALGFGF
ncbi:metallophosphoesterase [Pseudotenacibaculum sp. MALMAid0570]|uniref:metallophosphoesterase n=1 Tax=Pseudotenacibaculum sp. MALMAid0570 TaxID=3143938 RepID=UPI0032DF8AAB